MANVTDGDVIQLKLEGFTWECTGIRGHAKTANNLFGASCLFHDVMYTIGGTEADRREADEGFFKRCLSNAGAFKSPWKRWYYKGVAFSWFAAVRTFGWAFFRYGKCLTNFDDILAYNSAHHGKGFFELPLAVRFEQWMAS